MWFRNLIIFRLPAPWAVTAAALEERLARRVLRPCGAGERESRGWLEARTARGLVHQIGGHWLLCLGAEQRLLPASVVAQFVDERALEFEAQHGYRPSRRQLRELKERVTEELLPRAFVRRRRTWAWIDPHAGWLVVDAASDNRAEELVETLRDTLDELPLRRLDTERAPGSMMTEWVLSGEAPADFTLDRDLELRAPDEEKATVRYVRHVLEGAEIAAHVGGGKRATRLALTWNQRVSFVLTEMGHVKRVSFLDVVRESLDPDLGDAEAEFDAQLALMAGEFGGLLPALIEALGGERAVEA